TLKTPHVTTLHGRLDFPELVGLYREFPDMPVVSISDAQRLPLPWLNWAGTVYHGLPPALYPFHPEPQSVPGPYLAFLGRISPEKGLDRAIEIAKRTGIRLRVAAKVDASDREFFNTHIRPLFEDPLVEFIGEVGERDKRHFLGKALAT